MTLTYVLRNFKRRKARTILMLLALIVGVAALVALNATVDTYQRFYVATISNDAGDYDLVITKKETDSEPLIDEAAVLPIVRARDSAVKQVVARIQGVAEVDVSNKKDDEAENKVIHGNANFIALNPAIDNLGDFEVISGTLNFDSGYAVVLQETADTFGLHPGDTFNISYALPIPRRKGVAAAANVSTKRAKITLTVSAIAIQRGVTGMSGNDGVVVSLEMARQWLAVAGLAERVVVAFEEDVYNNNDPQAAAFRVRFLSEKIQAMLGESYDYKMPRATILSDSFEAFIFFQALVSIYGLLSLGVVGLLIRTMVMTNIREQTRDLALFRILGAPRSFLFNLVAVEVAILGAMGIGTGAIAGQLFTNLVIVPFIIQQANVPSADVPLVTLRALLLSILTAAVVLFISAYSPARRASGTKIMYAINPGVAEGLGFDDLAKLRERRVDFRIFWSGLIALFYPALIFFAFPLAFTFGVLWLQATLIFGSLLLLILGTAMLFFPVTLPMQRLLVELINLVVSRVGYFSKRNVLRNQSNNTLISLMIVISATLPTFFATTLAIDVANTATDVHLNKGTPLEFRRRGTVLVDNEEDSQAITEVKNRFPPKLLQTISSRGELGPNVAVSYRFNTTIRDNVGLRNVSVRAYGIDGNLAAITYREGITWIQGDDSSFDELQRDPNAVIVSQGLAEYFERGMGDTIRLNGAGLDHTQMARIVGVLGRFSGFNGFTSKRTNAERGMTDLFVNEQAFREMTRDPLTGPYDPTYPIFERLMAAPNLRADLRGLPSAVGEEAIRQTATNLRREFGLTENVSVSSTPEIINTIKAGAQQIQVVILVLTTISFILAIFGVFVVTYISVYSRRSEIAMLKAIGDSNRHIFGMFLIEALVMTLSATLTGIVAGIILGYIFRYSTSFTREIPTVFAFDLVVTPYMLLLMIIAAIVSTFFATWSYLRRKAIEIMRMV